jgi:hypothetical protein
MASRGKKKTTFSKLARESKLRERRQDKAARKDARKRGIDLRAEARGESPVGAESEETPIGEDFDGAPVGAESEETPVGAESGGDAPVHEDR